MFHLMEGSLRIDTKMTLEDAENEVLNHLKNCSMDSTDAITIMHEDGTKHGTYELMIVNNDTGEVFQ